MTCEVPFQMDSLPYPHAAVHVSSALHDAATVLAGLIDADHELISAALSGHPSTPPQDADCEALWYQVLLGRSLNPQATATELLLAAAGSHAPTVAEHLTWLSARATHTVGAVHDLPLAAELLLAS